MHDGAAFGLPAEQADRIMNAHLEIADGWTLMGSDGRVVLPMGKQQWGDVYGQVEDKFGFSGPSTSRAHSGSRTSGSQRGQHARSLTRRPSTQR